MKLVTELSVAADAAARRPLGCRLRRIINGQVYEVCIVEAEACDETDEASHTSRGKTTRNEAMFGRAGTLCVYFAHGMHYCRNVVVDEEGFGSAVFIRAVEPPGDSPSPRHGPARLCKSIGINTMLHTHDLTQSPLELIMKSSLADKEILSTPRTGRSKATHTRWRFYIKNNPYISKS